MAAGRPTAVLTDLKTRLSAIATALVSRDGSALFADGLTRAFADTFAILSARTRRGRGCEHGASYSSTRVRRGRGERPPDDFRPERPERDARRGGRPDRRLVDRHSRSGEVRSASPGERVRGPAPARSVRSAFPSGESDRGSREIRTCRCDPYVSSETPTRVDPPVPRASHVARSGVGRDSGTEN